MPELLVLIARISTVKVEANFVVDRTECQLVTTAIELGARKSLSALFNFPIFSGRYETYVLQGGGNGPIRMGVRCSGTTHVDCQNVNDGTRRFRRGPDRRPMCDVCYAAHVR